MNLSARDKNKPHVLRTLTASDHLQTTIVSALQYAVSGIVYASPHIILLVAYVL